MTAAPLLRLAGLSLLLCVTSASAQTPEEFYKANRVTIVVGSPPGGGYDSYARLVARHLSRHIPGEPSIIVQNMPSVASITAANYTVNIATRDGTVIAAVQREIATVQLTGGPGPQFRAVELNWLGSLLSEPSLCAIATRTGITSFADVFKNEYPVGSTGPNGLLHHPAMFNNLLGAKFKVVQGYKASADVALAVERGELAGVCQSWATFKQHYGAMMGAGKIKPLVQVSLKHQPEMDRLGLPMYTQFVTPDRIQPGYTREDVLDYFSLQLGSSVMGRPYLMAPGVPADRLATMVKAFEDFARDPEVLADAAKTKRDIDFVSGQEIKEIVERMASLPKAKLDKLEDVMKY
jgi:tripartite-type tricarboxylate transporter receptor subunit TctC